MDPYLSRCRRHLHQIPETDWHLPETLSFLRGELEPLPCTLFEPVPGALAAWFDRGREETVAFRADMDALPIQEKTDRPYASRHPGAMHACGHDGHMAIALGLAREAAARPDLPHNLLFLFQPAEETTGGARPICETGLLEARRVKAVYGFHLWPGMQVGEVATRPGPLLAQANEVTVRIQGRSAHIARAAQGADALLAGARFLVEADRLITDRLSKEEPCLLKFGRMESGSARNAISGGSVILGSLRVFSEGMFRRAREELAAICRGLEKQTGCRFDLQIADGYPPVTNDQALVARAARLLPGLRLLDEPLLIGEDFSFYQRRCPGLFLLLGTGRETPLHADTFDFDEEALEAGVAAGAALLFSGE